MMTLRTKQNWKGKPKQWKIDEFDYKDSLPWKYEQERFNSRKSLPCQNYRSDKIIANEGALKNEITMN